MRFEKDKYGYTLVHLDEEDERRIEELRKQRLTELDDCEFLVKGHKISMDKFIYKEKLDRWLANYPDSKEAQIAYEVCLRNFSNVLLKNYSVDMLEVIKSVLEQKRIIESVVLEHVNKLWKEYTNKKVKSIPAPADEDYTVYQSKIHEWLNKYPNSKAAQTAFDICATRINHPETLRKNPEEMMEVIKSVIENTESNILERCKEEINEMLEKIKINEF